MSDSGSSGGETGTPGTPKRPSALIANSRIRCGDRLDTIYIAPGTSWAEAERRIRSYADDHPLTDETYISGDYAYEMDALKWELIAGANSRMRAERRREAASLRRAIARALRGTKAGGNEAAAGPENGDS